VSTFIDGADVRFPADVRNSAADVRPPAEARNGAAPPSMVPEPAAEPEHCDKRGERGAADDTGSMWLQDEIARRIAAKGGSGSRHARRDNPDPSAAPGYVPRHSKATPGPAAAAPGQVGGLPPTRRRSPNPTPGTSDPWVGPGRSDPVRADLGRSTVGSPSRPADPLPARPPAGSPPRPSGAAAARLLSAPVLSAPVVAPPHPVTPYPAAAHPVAANPTAAHPVTPPVAAPPVTAPPAARPPVAPPPGSGPPRPPSSPGAPDAADPTAAWPVTPSRPLTPPAAGSSVGDVRPSGVPTRPARNAPDTGPRDEILWSASSLPPSAPAEAEEGPAATPAPGTVSVPEQRVGEAPRGARFQRPDEPEAEAPAKRVRVVLAERKGVARPVRTVVDIQEATAVGELLRSNLIGSQLRVALRFAAGAGLTLGVLPLLFALFPAIGEFNVFGLRLPWLLLGVLVYPFLFGLGWWHTRTAERVEQNFADHVQE